ncbi:MAG: glycosyltransferase family 4 protein [Leptotrichiaceae bacterium]|nr:glycosyltransferase family 4 protein [Leptotrichiaceae bacterium]
MKIGIDLKPFFTGSKYRGIGKYSRELINNMIEEDSENEYHYLNMYDDYQGDPKINEKCFLHQYFSGPKIIDVGERQLFNQESMDSFLEKEVSHFIENSDIDVMIFTSPNEYGNLYKKKWFDNILTVGILYDLIPLVFPEQCLFDPIYKADYEKSLTFIKELDVLLAISESAKEDAVNLLGLDRDKIFVIYAGLTEEFKKIEKIEVKKMKEKYNISKPFILFSGGIDFKKNIEGLIKAYSMLPKEIKNRYQLVITGKASEDMQNKFLEIANKNDVLNNIILTGYIPTEDQIQLYNMTELFVFPSLYEGFGLPVIEAMACGARVLTSNTSSLLEIAENRAILVDPQSTRSIMRGIKYVLENPLETLELAESSIQYAKSYTWKNVANLAIKAINENYKTKKTYKPYINLSITDEIIDSIVNVYIKSKIQLSDESLEKITDILYSLENNISIKLSGKNRIIYDVTVVHEWLKNNYNTGIGRVSKELLKSIKNKCIVIPVQVQKTGDITNYNYVSMYDYEEKNEKIEIQKNDIFFMPEFQVRGVQIKNDHPYANELRKNNNNCYAVVYDLLPIEFPNFFEIDTSRNFKKYIFELINNYSGILTDSKSVADELINFHNSNSKNIKNRDLKIGFFHLGQNSFDEINLTGINSKLVTLFNTEQSVYLMVGTIEPRKGHELVLKSFESMWEKGFEGKLCIMGHIGWKMEEFLEKIKKHNQYEKKIFIIEASSDSEIYFAYSKASALIQASAGEGFGLPIIEAAIHNLPIICSDIPVFHEVSNDFAIFFSRDINDDLENKIFFFEKNKKNPEIIPQSKNIKSNQWQDSADKVYSMIVENEDWYAEKRDDKVIKI